MTNLSGDIKKYSSFDRELRVNDYKVDIVSEEIIDEMNRSLLNIDNIISHKIKDSSYPSIIVTGMPRSGTTLLTQLLSSRYDIGYVSNLMARFYNAPLMGAWLQKKLIPDDIHSLREYSSLHGVTNKIYEPHEFGFFWARYLSLGTYYHEPNSNDEINRIDFNALNQKLMGISTVFQNSVLYKCSLAPFLLKPMLQSLNIFVIHIVREKEANINSVINVREQRLGNKNLWWSIRPVGWENFKNKTPEEQVTWQYNKVIETIRNSICGFEDRVIEISLEELLIDPELTLERCINAFFDYSGKRISQVGQPLMKFK